MDASIFSDIRATARRVIPGNGRVILFGSQARGDSHKGSDWDLLILLDKPRIEGSDHDRYTHPFWKLGWKTDAMVHPVICTLAGWEGKISLLKSNAERDGTRICQARRNGKRSSSSALRTFHMARTLLLDKGMESHTHAGTIHLIGKNSISGGLLDKSYGRLLSQSYELRQSGDYDDRFDATKEEAQPFFGQVRAIHRRREKLAFLPPGMSCSA